MARDSGKLLKKIIKATDPACDIAMRYYGASGASLKPDRSYVTRADRDIESMLRGTLPAIIPGSAVLGEEQECADDCDRLADAEWVWVIDPIDGTSAFIDGLPTFCISVGLMRAGRPYAGVLRLPATGDIYESERGHGAFYNGKRISTGGPLKRHDLPICVPSKSHLRYRITHDGKTRNLSSTALHFALVARGAALAAVARAHLWDVAAAAAILLEAGGSIRHLDGSRIDWRASLRNRGEFPAPLLGAHPSRWKNIASSITIFPPGTVPDN